MRFYKRYALLGLMLFKPVLLTASENESNPPAFPCIVGQNFTVNLADVENDQLLIPVQYQELVELTIEPFVKDLHRPLARRILILFVSCFILYECLQIGK